MKNKAFPLIFSITIILTSILASRVSSEEQVIEFEINILSPNTSVERNNWALYLEEELPKIGIRVAKTEITGWGNIAPRSWVYPIGVEYDYIPTYAEGGYDVILLYWHWSFDLNQLGSFSSEFSVWNNFYQYENSTYDTIISDFMLESEEVERTELGNQLQEILHEDLPSIGLHVPQSLIGFNENITGINTILLQEGIPRVEFWNDTSDQIITFAKPYPFYSSSIYGSIGFYDKLRVAMSSGSLLTRNQSTFSWELEIADSIYVDVNEITERMLANVSLNPAACFSDGSSVLPEDIVESYSKQMNDDEDTPDKELLLKWFDSESSIYVDSTTENTVGGNVIFEINGIYNYWENLFDIPITDKDDFSAWKSCGPMEISGSSLVPNPYWHGFPVQINALIFITEENKETALSMLKTGAVDIVDHVYSFSPSDFENTIGIETITSDVFGQYEIAINMRHPILGTGELTPVGTEEAARNIRKAISHIIPRELFISEYLNGFGLPASYPLPESVIGFNDELEPYNYDIDLATDYMRAAGYLKIGTDTTGGNGVLLTMFISVVIVFLSKRKRK